MPQIAFRGWKLTATGEDTDILKLEVEALDGSDILEVGYAGEAVRRNNEPYVLHFSTEQLEAGETGARGERSARQTPGGEPGEPDEEGVWETDDEETVYTRGWEVNALVDEDGALTLEVERQDDAEIFALEPLESGVPLAPHVILRLAAEEEIDEEEDEEDEEELEEDLDDYEDIDELEEADEYDDLADNEEEEMEGLFEDEDERF